MILHYDFLEIDLTGSVEVCYNENPLFILI